MQGWAESGADRDSAAHSADRACGAHPPAVSCGPGAALEPPQQCVLRSLHTPRTRGLVAAEVLVPHAAHPADARLPPPLRVVPRHPAVLALAAAGAAGGRQSGGGLAGEGSKHPGPRPPAVTSTSCRRPLLALPPPLPRPNHRQPALLEPLSGPLTAQSPRRRGAAWPPPRPRCAPPSTPRRRRSRRQGTAGESKGKGEGKGIRDVQRTRSRRQGAAEGCAAGEERGARGGGNGCGGTSTTAAGGLGRRPGMACGLTRRNRDQQRAPPAASSQHSAAGSGRRTLRGAAVPWKASTARS